MLAQRRDKTLQMGRGGEAGQRQEGIEARTGWGGGKGRGVARRNNETTGDQKETFKQ